MCSPRTITAVLIILIFAIAMLAIIMPIKAPTPILSTVIDLDTTYYDASTIQEYVGQYYAESGNFTDTAVYAESLDAIAVSWISKSNTYYDEGILYLALIYANGTINKVTVDAYPYWSPSVKYVGSISAGANTLLITYDKWVSSYNKYDVYAALVHSPYNIEKISVATTSNYVYDEYSDSAWVPGWSKYVIIYWNSSDRSTYAVTLSEDGTLGSRFKIVKDWGYYKYSDQNFVIGGNTYALVAYRYSNYGDYDVEAALITETGVAYGGINVESTNGNDMLGVRGAYANKTFIVPFINSTGYVGFAIVNETDGTIVAKKYLGKGSAPYAISFINSTSSEEEYALVWIRTDLASGGDIYLTIIETDGTIVGTFTIDPDANDKVYHPFVNFNSDENILFITWTKEYSEKEIYYTTFNLSTLSKSPLGYFPSMGDQVVEGLAYVNSSCYTIIYKDYADGEEDLKALITMDSTRFEEGSIDVYFIPENSTEVLYGYKGLGYWINHANETIHAALAFFENMTVAEWLVNAKNRGVDVKLVIDDDSLEYDAVNYMIANSIPIVTDADYEADIGENHTMHHKFIVIDGKIAIIGTANPTTTGLGYNNETLAIIESRSLAYAFEREFKDLYGENFGTRDIIDESRIVVLNVGDSYVEIEAYFGPWSEHNIAHEINAEVDKAQETIHVASYIFTTSWKVEPIWEVILSKNVSGVNVISVFDDELNEDQQYRIAYIFYENGLPIAFERHSYKLHDKLFVIDKQVAIVGSYNPTGSATSDNDESIVIVHSKLFARKASKHIEEMFNKWYTPDYIWTAPHPVINEVYYYWTSTQWVEIYNPTNEAIDLSNWLIGDAENIFGDDEGMYRFPEGAILPPGKYIIVAYDAVEFKRTYGFNPTFEIAGRSWEVPDLTPYRPNMFTGSWNLDSNGDEVLLIRVDHGDFLMVIDAAWWGDSTYLPDPAPLASPGQSIERKDPGLDAPVAALVFEVRDPPTPTGPFIIGGTINSSGIENIKTTIALALSALLFIGIIVLHVKR